MKNKFDTEQFLDLTGYEEMKELNRLGSLSYKESI